MTWPGTSRAKRITPSPRGRRRSWAVSSRSIEELLALYAKPLRPSNRRLGGPVHIFPQLAALMQNGSIDAGPVRFANPRRHAATTWPERRVEPVGYTVTEHQRALLQAWVDALGKVMFPAAHTFSVDFHPIPYRGDPTGLDRHYIPCRGAAGPSVQTFFALEQESRCLCYANANLIRSDQPGELMQFVAFWHALTGQDPQWLYFDSKLVDYPELSNINKRGIHFITIRRRGAAILRRLDALPRSSWTGAVLDTPQRCHQRIWYVDESIKLRGYEGPIRQLAVDGLGREKPTLFLTNHFEETARNIVIRYAGRNRVEDGLGISVNFFHLDCLASEVRLNVDLDATLTVLANGCYRWLGKHLRGYEKAAPKQLYRLFVATQGFIKVTAR